MKDTKSALLYPLGLSKYNFLLWPVSDRARTGTCFLTHPLRLRAFVVNDLVYAATGLLFCVSNETTTSVMKLSGTETMAGLLIGIGASTGFIP